MRWRTAIEETVSRLSADPLLIFLKVTAKPERSILLSNLRQTSLRFLSNLHRRIGGYDVAGSLLIYETVPAMRPSRGMRLIANGVNADCRRMTRRRKCSFGLS
jgi:hypothetical protein